MGNVDLSKDKALSWDVLSSVQATSEQPLFPAGNAIDGQHGPGGSRWIAAHPGAQTVTLTFRAPQSVRSVSIESEEHAQARTQDVLLSVSRDGGATYLDLGPRAFSFRPYGPTFERETWTVSTDGVTHVRLRVSPDTTDTSGRAAGRASLTSVVVR